MSWLDRLKGTPASNPTTPIVSPRTAKRNKLIQDRLQRAHQREKLRKQLKSAQEAKEAADLAELELFALDPNIFEGAVDEEVSEDILDEIDDDVADFDVENGTDGDKALDKLGSVRCPFNKNDIEFWFTQVESQLEVIGVKSQWVKRLALCGLLPVEIQ